MANPPIDLDNFLFEISVVFYVFDCTEPYDIRQRLKTYAIPAVKGDTIGAAIRKSCIPVEWENRDFEIILRDHPEHTIIDKKTPVQSLMTYLVTRNSRLSLRFPVPFIFTENMEIFEENKHNIFKHMGKEFHEVIHDPNGESSLKLVPYQKAREVTSNII